MGVWTNAGLTLVATAVQSPGVNCAITYAALSTGAGTLATALTPVATTSLPLDAPLPANLGAGAGLTITDGVNTDTCVVGAGGASAGATSISVNSFTPAHSYAAHVTAVAPTPLATDTGLYNESVRIAANLGAAGATPGESLNAAYFDGTQPTGVYVLVGFFGGATATSALGTGILMGEDVQFWNHTLNADSDMFQADSTL